MSYRVFSARWWADKHNTKPIEGARRKKTIRVVETEEEARELCRQPRQPRRAALRQRIRV